MFSNSSLEVTAVVLSYPGDKTSLSALRPALSCIANVSAPVVKNLLNVEVFAVLLECR